MRGTRTARQRHAGGTRRLDTVLRIAAMTVAAIAGFAIVLVTAMVDRLDTTLSANAVDVGSLVGERPEKPAGVDDPDDPEAGRALTILLMGSDTRAGDNSSISKADAQGMRNDTTLLLHISADRTRVEAVSIPRDAQVQIPDCTYLDGTPVRGWYGDFNIAFSNGGLRGNAAEAAACTIKTVEDLTGIYIDHYAVADFVGFIDMVDALGGVPMCVPERIVSKKARLELDAGPQVFDGDTALAYARLRTAEEGGVSGSDLQRITRQQQLLTQMIRTVLSKNLLTDIDQLTQFIRAGAESLTMDPDLADTGTLLGLAYSLRGLDIADVTFTTVPWKYSADYLNVEIQPEAEQMWDDIRNDRPLTVSAEDDASSAWDDGIKDVDDTSDSAATPTPSDADASDDTTSEASAPDQSTAAEDLLALCR